MENNEFNGILRINEFQIKNNLNELKELYNQLNAFYKEFYGNFDDLDFSENVKRYQIVDYDMLKEKINAVKTSDNSSLSIHKDLLLFSVCFRLNIPNTKMKDKFINEINQKYSGLTDDVNIK